jgi:putative peptidoglycan lipid II flippase
MRLARFFNYASTGIIGGALILAASSLASRGLGFLRNALLAATYGAGPTLDAYFLAFRLPDFIFNLLFFGALSAGFVPVFIKLKERDSGAAWRLANDIFNISLITFSFFGAVFFFLAPYVMARLAPGFSASELELATTLSRIMFLQPIFLGISGIFSGVLQSTRRFVSYSLAPIFYNLGIIAGIVILVPIIGPFGLAWGVVLGAVLHLAVQYPATRASGWTWRPVLALREKNLARMLSIMVPRSLTLVLQQVNLIVILSLATVLGAGSVAVFNFANDLYSFPLGIIAVPLAVAAFPTFVRTIEEHTSALGAVLVRTLRSLLFVMVPLTVLAFVLRAQVVRLTLGYGKFGWEDTILTIDTFGFLLLGLLFQAVLVIVLRAYFALEDARTPFAVLLLSTVLTVFLGVVLRAPLGLGGLALAVSLGSVVSTVVLSAVLARRVALPQKRQFVRTVMLFVAGALLAGLAARGMLFVLGAELVPTDRVPGLIFQAAAATVAGGAAYLLVMWVLGVEELTLLRKKLPRGRFLSSVQLPKLPEEELPR